MGFLPEEPYKKIFCIVFYIILASFGTYILFKYALPILLPFIISFFIACAVRRPARYISEKIGVCQKAVSVFLGISALTACALFVSACASKLVSELYSFAKSMLESKDDIMASTSLFSQKIDRFFSDIFPDAHKPTLDIRQRLTDLLSEAVKNIVTEITTKIPVLVGHIFSGVPKILFFIVAMLLSCIYFCLELDNIENFIRQNMTKNSFAALVKVKKASFATIGKYIRANFIIFLMTAAELTIGFLIIGVKYALLLGVATAFIDILPIFGSGTVLIPFAVYGLMSGDMRLGIGILILYAIVTVVRQLSEPRIIGKNLGVHPLVSLTAVYAGYSLFGIGGMIFLPIMTVIVKNIFFTNKNSA